VGGDPSGCAAVDRFIARENIRHFRERLWIETDPDTRSRLRKYLIEEKDKLGASYELLADVERHIADGDRRIEMQRATVADMERDGHDGVAEARLVLERFMETQSLHKNYREQVRIKIKQNHL
jgi:hypothetical protein